MGKALAAVVSRGAQGLVQIPAPTGTIEKTPYKTNTCWEAVITVACYLCNTIPKTV
jgi:hypothetical protein